MEAKQDWPFAGACRVPAGMDRSRLWQWCVLRTLRDARLAKARGRPIAATTLARRLERRWRRAVEARGGEADLINRVGK